MTTLTASLIARLIDRVTAPARGVTSAMERMQAAQIRNTRALAASRGRMVEAGAAGYALFRALRAPIMGAAGFEQAMNRVGAVSQANSEQMAAMSQQARELGRTTQFTAAQAADAQGFLAMAGFQTNQILGAMPGTLQLAAAAQIDLGRSADIVSNVLTGYRLEVDQLNRVNDVLVATFTSANTDLSQLGEAMKFVGPVASAAGVEFETAAAAVGLMGNAGIQASMAGTSLRGAITRMLNPTRQVAQAMTEAGLNFTDAQGRLLPLSQIIEQLEPHADDAGLMMQLFGQRAGPAMAALVGEGSEALQEFEAILLDSGGTAERVAAGQMRGFMGFWREFTSIMGGLAIAIGSGVNPAIEATGRAFFPLLQGMTAFAEAHPQVVAAVVGLTAGLVALRVATIAANFAFLFMKGGLLSVGIAGARGLAVLAPLAGHLRAMAVGGAMLQAVGGASLFTGLASGLAAMPLVPFAVMAAGIVAIGLAVHKYWEPISNFVAGFASAIGDSLAPALQSMQQFGNDFLALIGIDPAAVQAGLDAIRDMLSGIPDFFRSIFSMNDYTDEQEAEFRNAGQRLGQALVDAIMAPIRGLTASVGRVLDGILSRVRSAADFLRRIGGGGGGAAAVQQDYGSGAELPGRAGGGYIRAGSQYWVGEREPEIFSSTRSGWITNQEQMVDQLAARRTAGSNVTIGDVHVHAAQGMSPEAVADAVMRQLEERLSDRLAGIHADTDFVPQVG
ncbi:MAG: phage tail tape measure protein [Pseudomonadota bacterium]